ncbi:hypothetical protein EDEG_03862 [Edhazardia aedis USNM 41457]|uniref:DNA-directed RNA polymerase subunit n=1 Tax=Edhazardia aedis (strain USNM 41457) TaxID=1003232 RepID=J9DJR3_EDHAE|nr:hypothetical protein EDEG_03862 [Edhazardia aedis USNM 41457]|eukprot:EJW01577.1 hypothetical protein EDEG_03862 [Edhazardia aedis USNM 41457]
MEIRFCQDCNNILYPKEDPSQRLLYLACRTCDYTIECPSNIVYVYRSDSSTAKAVTISADPVDLANDKTLARTNRICCEKCGNNEAVYFQTKDRQEEVALSIYFVCRKCYNLWSANKM